MKLVFSCTLTELYWKKLEFNLKLMMKKKIVNVSPLKKTVG